MSLHGGGPDLAVQGFVIGAETERRDVVGKGVEPDIDHVLVVTGVGNPPCE